MTVCVAVNTAKHAQPTYAKVAFESGIIMLADTRVTTGRVEVGDNTLARSVVADNIVKVDFLSDYAIGGYSGDVVVAERAIRLVGDEFNKHIKPDGASMAELAAKVFRENCPMSSEGFCALIGMKDSRSRSYRLYLLSSDNSFAPIEKAGLYAIGSHGAPYAVQYCRVFHEGQDLARNPFKQDRMPMWGDNSFANLLGELLSLELETAREAEGPRSFIGGSLRMLSLTDAGPAEAVGHQVFTDGIPRLELYPPVFKFEKN